MNSGALIVVEGIDGSGKSSNVRNIESFLSYSGIQHFVASEYVDTKFTNAVRSLINEQKGPQLDPVTEALMFYAARIEHTQKIILPYIDKGYHVVCDRYYPSTLSYQSVGTPVVRDIHNLVLHQLKEPDLILLYDIPPEVYEERVLSRGKGLDAIEGRGLDYFHQVRANFHKLAKNDDRFVIIDASRSLEDVFTESISHLNTFLRKFNEGHIQPE